ncbi:MAG: hypothetical protein JNL67_17430 [Planctomycetaceae bacterium]|nr:hypothetical protein [Planctomycetaceae bacterium]
MVLFLLLGFFVGCHSSEPSASQAPATTTLWQNQVTVVSFPLYEALQTAGGVQLNLFYPEVPSGKAIDRETVKRIQASRLIFLDGTHHVGWVDTVSLPETRKRYSTFDIMDQLIMVDSLGSHSHGPGGAHSHPGIVAQTWLDPALFKEQLETVLKTCASSDLIQESDVANLLENWWKTIRPLDDQLSELAKQTPRRTIVDRAGTEYLMRRLGWTAEIQDLDQAFASDATQLEVELRQRFAEDETLIVVFTKPAPTELVQLLERLKIPQLSLDLIEFSESGGYWERLAENLKNIENITRQGS